MKCDAPKGNHLKQKNSYYQTFHLSLNDRPLQLILGTFVKKRREKKRRVGGKGE
jgi:hypothetical protein